MQRDHDARVKRITIALVCARRSDMTPRANMTRNTAKNMVDGGGAPREWTKTGAPYGAPNDADLREDSVEVAE